MELTIYEDTNQCLLSQMIFFHDHSHLDISYCPSTIIVLDCLPTFAGDSFFTSHDSLGQHCLDSVHCIDSNSRAATTIVWDSMVGCGAGSSGCAGGSGCTAVGRSCTPRTGSAD